MAVYTFSGHRMCPGQEGLIVNPTTYNKIDAVYGPSSWTVRWHIENNKVYAENLEIGDIDSPILENNGTIREILLSDENLIANLLKGLKDSKVNEYIQSKNISFEYVNNTRVKGWHGFVIRSGNEKYEKSICWPWKASPGFIKVMDDIRQLVNPEELQLLMKL